MKIGVAGQTAAVTRRRSGLSVARLAALMHVEYFAHRGQQRSDRLAAVGGVFVTAAVPAVHIEIGIQKEGMPGGVVVEFEAGQVDAVHPRNADAFVARTESFDLRVVIGNLPIPRPAFGSADAAENDEKRFA